MFNYFFNITLNDFVKLIIYLTENEKKRKKTKK